MTLRRARRWSAPQGKPMTKGTMWACVAMAFVSQLAFGTGYAETFPSKLVRIVVGAPPGGPLDTLTRGIAPKVGEALGQPVVVENRAGAAGVIATDFVAKSPPDGHTLLMAFSTHVTNPYLVAKLPYDTLKDFNSV